MRKSSGSGRCRFLQRLVSLHPQLFAKTKIRTNVAATKTYVSRRWLTARLHNSLNSW
jgi:hypothetical protein